MLFNSPEFFCFLVIVFFTYWAIPSTAFRVQNCLLLVASYVFYGWWDARCLLLILLSSVLDFCVSLAIGSTTDRSRKKAFLAISLICNLGMLATFKYFNFFAESFVTAMTSLGFDVSLPRLRLILPVGISFYTFQTVSYSIDVYRGHLKPTRDLVAFLTFVSFFPQLVAGPIERATHLLPQFLQRRSFDFHLARDGLRQILWGLFKKMVIADNCAIYADQIFGGYLQYSSATLLAGAALFSMQIYGDFSGYSDIATGTARLFGFSLMQNFAFPYFSRDIAEFWRRWHISLSTWFRDYVYLPLGGSRCSRSIMIRNTMIVFIVSGLWHGANWTFVLWGLINGLYFLPLQLSGRNRTAVDDANDRKRLIPSLTQALQISFTFFLTMTAWIFFRSETASAAFSYILRMFSAETGESSLSIPGRIPILIGAFLVAEWLQRSRTHALDLEGIRMPKAARWAIYYGLIMAIVAYGGDQQEFIYFQF